MNKRPTSGKKLRVAIAGAGPAGSSLGIRLATAGYSVTLIERETFPREKLCGEFISPECLGHFSELGVRDEMAASGGESIYETRFFSRKGRNFAVPSDTFGGPAISLSRSRMDEVLLSRAKSAGAEVLEGARIADARVHNGSVAELAVIDRSGRERLVTADLFVDATGRGFALTKLVQRKRAGGSVAGLSPRRPLAVGFKSHLTGTAAPAGVCEIYFFPGGYAGLSRVEGGRANLCFLVSPDAAKEHSGNAETIVRELVRTNRRAAETLGPTFDAGEWLAVSINSFGERQPMLAAANLIGVGDAAAFIDPFTGSGMLMALESASLLSKSLDRNGTVATAAASYKIARSRSFSGRLRVCGALRWAAFMPVLPGAAIALLEFSARARAVLAGATRGRSSARV